jgi:hypothetical protein
MERTPMYINAPIDPEKIAHIREIMQAHRVMVLKIRPDLPEDHWWHFFFPKGTTQREITPSGGGKKSQEEIPRYEVVFPDGYRFLYEAGTKSRNGLFTRDPVLLLESTEPPKSEL